MLATLGGLALVFGLLAVLLALVAVPVILALFITGVVLRLAFFVLLLPFRLIGTFFGLGFWAAGMLIRNLILFGGIAFLLLLGLAPLLPFILIGAGLYLVFRGARGPSAPVGQS